MTAPAQHDQRSDAERAFHDHMGRWGSDGYPVRKLTRGWVWEDAFGVKGAPKVFMTKRECVAAIEAFLSILHEKAAGRWTL